MARSRVELFEAIRRDRRIDGLSVRELADKHGVHRRTVRQAGTVALSHRVRPAQQIFLSAPRDTSQTAPSGPPKSSQRRRPAAVERGRTARFTARPSRDRSMQQCPAADVSVIVGHILDAVDDKVSSTRGTRWPA